jgi:hypothetical protein
MTLREKKLRALFNGLLSVLLLIFSSTSLFSGGNISFQNLKGVTPYLILGIIFSVFTVLNICDILKQKKCKILITFSF